jgi:hypothetical protein
MLTSLNARPYLYGPWKSSGTTIAVYGRAIKMAQK